MNRIDDDALDSSFMPELHDHPVVTRAATPLRFPAVTHVHAASRHDEVVTMAEEHVARFNDARTVLDCREVDFAALCELRPVRCRLAMHAQAGHTAVRK